MANLITINTYSSLNQAVNGKAPALPAVETVINVNKIISITERTSTTLPLGVSVVLYEYPVNQSVLQIELICTETVAAIVALANAALLSA